MRYTVPVLVNSITALHLLAPVKLTPVVYPAGPALAEKIGEFAGSGFLFKVPSAMPFIFSDEQVSQALVVPVALLEQRAPSA